jgi:hypothetical protein
MLHIDKQIVTKSNKSFLTVDILLQQGIIRIVRTIRSHFTQQRTYNGYI